MKYSSVKVSLHHFFKAWRLLNSVIYVYVDVLCEDHFNKIEKHFDRILVLFNTFKFIQFLFFNVLKGVIVLKCQR